jgi:hypothetical protein
MEAAQIWWERYNRKKMYSRLAGYVFQRVKITTGKKYNQKNKVQLSCLTGHFSGGFKLQPEKITNGKIKGTVIWPMKAAQIWWECNDQTKMYSRLAGYVFQRVQITTGKNMTRKKMYSCPAVSWKLEKLRPEKSYSCL